MCIPKKVSFSLYGKFEQEACWLVFRSILRWIKSLYIHSLVKHVYLFFFFCKEHYIEECLEVSTS